MKNRNVLIVVVSYLMPVNSKICESSQKTFPYSPKQSVFVKRFGKSCIEFPKYKSAMQEKFNS